MDVSITREPKVAKADHLFVLIAEGSTPHVDVAAKAMQAIAAAGFTGRAEDTLTTVAGEPKKITLVGIGHRLAQQSDEALQHRIEFLRENLRQQHGLRKIF